MQVAQFISKLNAVEAAQDVNLVISDEYKQRRRSKLRQFQIEMTLNPNAEVQLGDGAGRRLATAVDASAK